MFCFLANCRWIDLGGWCVGEWL
uniref:Uncharacterized protein n=1 Tax=Arundo donax TaxID=35708 RepID=A0A0A9A1Q8_ARUDO